MTTKVITSTELAKKHELPNITEQQAADLHIENVSLTSDGVEIDYAFGSGDCDRFTVCPQQYNEWLKNSGLLHCEFLGKDFDVQDYWDNTDYDVRLMDAKTFMREHCIKYNQLTDLNKSIANLPK